MAIAMTFDDGPSSQTTPRLLALLEEFDLQVTFFVVGRMVNQNPGVLKQIARAKQQHEICNHSWKHSNFKQLTDREIRSEIEDTQKAVEDIVGAAKASKIVRPPYGAIKQKQKEFISKELGYKIIGWDVDPKDWSAGRTSKQITEHVTTFTKDGQVILAHDIHRRTIEAMPETLKTLKKKFTFNSVSKLGRFTEGGLAWGVQCGCDISFA